MIDCAACQERRCHTAEEWKNHPLAGHGYTPETGWTHPEAQRAHEREVLGSATRAIGSAIVRWWEKRVRKEPK